MQILFLTFSPQTCRNYRYRACNSCDVKGGGSGIIQLLKTLTRLLKKLIKYQFENLSILSENCAMSVRKICEFFVNLFEQKEILARWYMYTKSLACLVRDWYRCVMFDVNLASKLAERIWDSSIYGSDVPLIRPGRLKVDRSVTETDKYQLRTWEEDRKSHRNTRNPLVFESNCCPKSYCHR